MMKRICCALLAALMLFGACALCEKATPTPVALDELLRQPDATITVQGNGVVNAVPDMVTLTVNATATAGTILDAQTQVSAIVENATAKLLELGVLGSDIITTSYGYNPNYSYESDVRRLIGYQASHTMEITCRDTEMLDGVIGVVTDSGMTDIYNVSYGVSDRSGLYEQALSLAILSAQEKAQTMAEVSGKTLAGLESLTENQSYDARYAVMGTANSQDAALATGIRAGGVSVSASVTAVYRAQ